MKIRTLTTAVLLTLICAVASAQDAAWTEQYLTEQKSSARTAMGKIGATADCPPQTVTLPTTINGTFTTSSCKDFLNSYEAVYRINVSAGETITIDYKSSAFDTFLFVWLGSTSMPTTRISFLPGLSRVTATYTFTKAGTYDVEAGTLFSADSSHPTTGPYTLSITTSKVNADTCSTATTACLLNKRFRASIRYKNQFSNPSGFEGTFKTARLDPNASNPDVALFGFDSAQAVEVVVRIVDARPFAPRFDVYYGGLTDVEYWVTVTDTQTGVSKEYHNAPFNVGGGVDRATFPAN